MSNILHITASIQGDASVSRTLSSTIARTLSEQTGATVLERDLSANDLPFVSAERFAANGTPAGERTPEQQELAAMADTLIAELEQADTIVLGVPIYNFGVPASVKAWADLVARAGTTFKYTENGPVGLLEGKKAYVAVASGGTPVNGMVDFMTPWLQHFLGFLGIQEVRVIAADALMGGDAEQKIADATQTAQAVAA